MFFLNIRNSEAKPGQIFHVSKSFFFLVFVSIFCILPQVTHANTLTKIPNNLGLIAYWSFNEGTSTTVADTSGYMRHGTMSGFANPATSVSGWGSGKLGKGLIFDGSNDIVDIDRPIYPTNTNWSFSAWVKATPTTAATIYGEGESGVNNRKIFIGRTNSAKLRVTIQNTAGTTLLGVSSTGDVFDGNWHHIVFSDANGTAALYIDGTLDASNFSYTRTGTFVQDSSNMGCTQEISCNDPFIGSLDEVRLYNRALSASDAAVLYKTKVSSRRLVSNRSLVGWWPMEEGTSTLVTDYSGNNNHGTTSNMSVTPSTESGWRLGKLGKALGFDGTDDRVYIMDSSSLNFNGITTTTFAAWIYLDNYPGAGSSYISQIIGDESACALGGSTIWRIGSQGNILYRGRIGINFRNPTDHDDQNNTDIPLRTWTHIAVTTDGTNVRYYINGRLDTTNAYTFAPFSTPCSWTIGFYLGGNGRAFDGKIDDVRLYKRTLSTDEISALARLNQTAGAKAQTGVVPKGLVGYWSFGGEYMNWNNNRALDASPLGNDGTITNMSTSTSAVQGILGQALKFDGVDDYVNVGDPTNGSLDFDITSPLSISAWVNRATLGSSVGIVVKRMAVTSGYDFSIVGSNDHVQFGIGDNFGSNFRIGNETANPISNPNQWYHVVATYNGNSASSGINIYVDGVKQSLTNAFDNYGGGSTLSSDPFTIGARASGTERQFNGRIDEVRVYNRVLSDSEVLQLYRANR